MKIKIKENFKNISFIPITYQTINKFGLKIADKFKYVILPVRITAPK
jgi:hypothetical protein